MTGYKTIITAGTAALAAIIAWLVGEMPGEQAIMAVWGLLMVVTSRIGLDISAGGFLVGYKTYALAVVGMLGSIGGWASGQITIEEMITALVVGLTAIFFRNGIAKI